MNAIISRARFPFQLQPIPSNSHWVALDIPTDFGVWPEECSATSAAISKLRFWYWPSQPVYFIADPHADPQAFIESLMATGGIHRTGTGWHDFELTKAGANAKFIIGGDCLGKGPANLALLRAIRQLKDLGAQVILLVGNHDIRLLLALQSVGLQKNPAIEHLFVNMAIKSMALFKEVYDAYCQETLPDLELMEARNIQHYLLPSDAWPEQFKALAKTRLGEPRLLKELNKTFKNLAQIEKAAAAFQMNLWQVYLAVLKCKELFLETNGEFSWFFKELDLVHKDASFLYLHAGVDDELIQLLAMHGHEYLNQLYRYQIENDLFSFYYGPLGNAIWTKYRESDLPLSAAGVKQVQALGINAIVHGHRSQLGGQHLRSREGLIHIEADTTLNCNSRAKLGVKSKGVGVTIIHPEGCVLGISNDNSYIKHFSPKRRLQPLARILQAIFK